MAAATPPKEAKISIKLMLQKDKNKVIFAEADNNFVDILFSFMTLPLGTIARILEGCPDKKDVALGGLKNLYQSLKDLPASYLSTDESKCVLLNPRSSAYDLCRNLKINIDDTEPLKYFICQNLKCSEYSASYSHCKFAKCRICCNKMDTEITYEDQTANSIVDEVNGGVFVSDVSTFIVTDDLRVMPNTSDFCFQLLCDHGIANASQLEERTFDVGREQILLILKGALLSRFSLTYLVFPRTQFKSDLVGTLVQPVMKNKVGTNTKRMTLKVFLQKSTSNFLFAEAEEDFVDFVFGFFGIPLGFVVGKLMNGTTSLVSLDNLFVSTSYIKEGRYFRSKDVKGKLLEPNFWPKYVSQNRIFPLNVSCDPYFYFHCYWSCKYVMYLNQSSSSGCRSNEIVLALCSKDPRVNGSF